MEAMKIYNALRECPKEAQKTIGAGKLKGFTDINPMWRIQRLTETFGPAGFGWRCPIVDHWTETAAGETSAWVRVQLFVKDPETGAWSEPIDGIGGSKQNGKGQGDGINDEAFKMAYTDAISVACKSLGMAADIYYGKGAVKAAKDNLTKYDAPAPAQQRGSAPAEWRDDMYWSAVRKYVDGIPAKNGSDYRTAWIAFKNPTAQQVSQFDKDVLNLRDAKEGRPEL